MSNIEIDYEINSVMDESAIQWGTLAHVDVGARERILVSGFGQIERHIKHIEKELKKRRKEEEKSRKSNSFK